MRAPSSVYAGDQEKSSQQLSFVNKIGYGIGETGLNFLVGGISSYLLFFYTDVFGITAGAAGMLMLIGRFWDAANDPLMGIIGDRTQTRWGKYRPYILFAAPPVVILTVLTFSTPNLSPTGKIVWAYITYFGWCTAFTAIAVPYNALMANLTTDSQERSSLGAIKTIFAVIGAMLVIVLAKPMTESIGGSLQRGYTLTFGIFGGIALILFVVCFFSVREKQEVAKAKAASFFSKAQLKALINNRPLMAIILFFLCFQVAFSLFRTIELYYFIHVLKRGELFSLALLFAHLFAVAGMAMMPFCVKRFDKKRSSLYGASIGSFFLLLMYLVPGNVPVALLSISLSYFFVSVTFALFFATVPDTVEYGQWKSGVRAAALIFSVFTFTQKLGMAVAAGLAGWILESAGYTTDQVQSPGVLHAILLMRTLIPLGLIVSGMLLFAVLYNLTREKHQEILDALKIRGL
jgi:glycoside/pentoside/hexuronide:cation symporter, GPH family